MARLTPADREARRAALLRALVEYPSVRAAAEASGIPVRSCYRYLADPGFRRDLETLRERQLSAVVDALRAAGTRAVERLRAGLDSRDEKVAIRAADRLLTHLLAGWEARELERRLAALETAHEYRMAEGQGERA